MRKREEYCQNQATITRTKKKKNARSPCMQRVSRSKGINWQLSAGKQFCLEIGSFTWEDFLDAKKYSQYYATSAVENWDDSAAEEAFNHAKNRFMARGLQPRPDDDHPSMTDPNLYIDEIKWDDDLVDPDLLEELESAKLPKDNYDDHVQEHPIQIQDIKPTGWDVDVNAWESNVLTGLIVGS